MSAPSPIPHALVLLATHNGARWLDEQLGSIVAQQGVCVSVIVSDDHSSDDTIASLDRWAADHRLALSRLPPTAARLGAAGNFLRLLREAPLEGADLVALADQDDVWQPGRLARALAQLREHGAQGYSSDVMVLWPDGHQVPLGKACPQRAFDHLFEPAGPGCTYAFSPDLAKALQQELRSEPPRFEGIGYHDWLIYAYARLQGFRWVIDPEPGVLYRQHANNELGANVGPAGARRRLRRLTSGWFRGQVLQIASLWPGAPVELLSRLRRLGIGDRVWLAAHASQLRRRPRDQLALAATLLLGVLR
jgi:rhamnosyltransferase